MLTLLVGVSYNIAAQAQTEAERKAEADTWDRYHLRYATGVVTDTSKEFIMIPEGYPGKRDFEVAKTPPTIDFAPIRGLNPEFFPEDNKGIWSQWGEVTTGPNGCYYMATGDHRSKDSQVIITEYDPAKKEQRIVVNVGKVCGWKPGLHTDGKIHGRMDIMPDGTLVAATWLGRDVKPDDIEHGWLGGYLLTYNVFTGMAESHGIPMLNYSWPYHVTDTQTGVFMAVGYGYSTGTAFLAYNVLKRTVLFAGMPPDNISLNLRATLLDGLTGLLYSTDNNKNNTFVCYDQRTNRFRHLACATPPNPATGKNDRLRAYTEYRTPDNIFYCIDQVGTMFKFFPEEERTEYMDINWDQGVYTTSMAISPQFRYLYYLPGSHGGTMNLGTPVVQYDLMKKQKKAIAFLGPFYHEKYGYATTGTYGIELSKDGTYLVISMNGGFGPNPHKSRFEHTAIFVVHIPESERQE
jgi:hypothetical protein